MKDALNKIKSQIKIKFFDILDNFVLKLYSYFFAENFKNLIIFRKIGGLINIFYLLLYNFTQAHH